MDVASLKAKETELTQTRQEHINATLRLEGAIVLLRQQIKELEEADVKDNKGD